MGAAAVPHTRDPLPLWSKIAIAAIGLGLFLVVLASLPLPIPAYLDFQVLYQTDMGLLRGISPYDHAGQVQMIAQIAHVPPEQVYVLPFPYPPWYALSTLWLAWLFPIEVAARIWFGISLALLLLSTWLLTDGWDPRLRLPAFGFAIFFLPVMGSLFVGQYVFPVLLGAALMSHALRHENAMLAALAAGLLTFKPHLGGPILLVVLLHLWQRKDAFGRRTLGTILGIGVVLFLIGFLADRAWPVSYLRSLLAFRQDSGVSRCNLCASLPALILSLLNGVLTLAPALAIGALILVSLGALWIMMRRSALQDPALLIAVSILVLLLASPYLFNYDFLLLLVPFGLLALRNGRVLHWILLAAAYLLPFMVFSVLGRQGNFVYPLAALILLIMLYVETRQIDRSSIAEISDSHP